MRKNPRNFHEPTNATGSIRLYKPKSKKQIPSGSWQPSCGANRKRSERVLGGKENKGVFMKTTTRRSSKRETPSATVESILVPIDFSNASRKALVYAAALAKQFGAKITPLYVVDLPEVVGMFQLLLDDEEMKEVSKSKLVKFLRKASVPGDLVATVLVRKGRPHREITEAARTLKVDLIVISTHGYTGVNRALLGSVTERVVRAAPCPVLVVREREHEFVQTREQKGVEL
jgi:universal stress protein A